MPQRRLNVKAVIGQGQGGRIYIQYVWFVSVFVGPPRDIVIHKTARRHEGETYTK